MEGILHKGTFGTEFLPREVPGMELSSFYGDCGDSVERFYQTLNRSGNTFQLRWNLEDEYIAFAQPLTPEMQSTLVISNILRKQPMQPPLPMRFAYLTSFRRSSIAWNVLFEIYRLMSNPILHSSIARDCIAKKIPGEPQRMKRSNDRNMKLRMQIQHRLERFYINTLNDLLRWTQTG